jgi:hypothetical protein
MDTLYGRSPLSHKEGNIENSLSHKQWGHIHGFGLLLDYY